MDVKVFITKGTHVIVDRFEINLGASLAGAQPKFGATRSTFAGTVRHVRGDHPTSPTEVAIWVEPDDGAEALGAQMCEKCGVFEVGPIKEGQFRPYTFADRAAEKQAARDADQAAVASGEKTAEQVNRENGIAFQVVGKYKMGHDLGVPKKLR